MKTKFESEIGNKERNKKLRQEIEENGFGFISPWIYDLSGYLMFSRGEFQESIEITKKPFFVLTIGRNLIYYNRLRFKFSETKKIFIKIRRRVELNIDKFPLQLFLFFKSTCRKVELIIKFKDLARLEKCM